MQVCAFETHQHLRLSIRVVLLRQKSLWGIFTKSNLYSLWLFLTIFDYRTQKVKEVFPKNPMLQLFVFISLSTLNLHRLQTGAAD